MAAILSYTPRNNAAPPRVNIATLIRSARARAEGVQVTLKYRIHYCIHPNMVVF